MPKFSESSRKLFIGRRGLRAVGKVVRSFKDRRKVRLVFLTTLALLAFAGNSVLCRLALKGELLEPQLFTAVRVSSGAAVLMILSIFSGGQKEVWREGSWKGSGFLALYMVAFSYAYCGLETGAGALILFGAVQVTMVAWAMRRGERLSARQWVGLLVAMGGLVWLLAPGGGASELWAGGVMTLAGFAWGGYTLCGKDAAHPLRETSGNFVKIIPVVLLLVVVGGEGESWSVQGLILAVISGVVTSAIGYAIWYEALQTLSATRAAVLQLLVPVLASIGGLVFGSEILKLSLVISSLLVLGGVSLVLMGKSRKNSVSCDSL